MTITFRDFPAGSDDYSKALALREEILRKPLGLQWTQAELSKESECFHLGGFDGTRLVAVLLLQPLDDRVVKMRQVAVSGDLQQRGVGSKLIAYAEEFAHQHGYREITAHARATALEFYLRAGYSASGDEFLELTIPHRVVTKTLTT